RQPRWSGSASGRTYVNVCPRGTGKATRAYRVAAVDSGKSSRSPRMGGDIAPRAKADQLVSDALALGRPAAPEPAGAAPAPARPDRDTRARSTPRRRRRP